MLMEKFETLFDTPESVEELRKLILDAAMRGKLVPQDPEEDAVDLEQIRQTKKELLKQKKIKERQLGKTITFNKIADVIIPRGWLKVLLNEVSIITMGQSPKGNDVINNLQAIPLIGGAAELSNNCIVTRKSTWNGKAFSDPGDIIYCVRATIGKPTFADKQYVLGRGVASIKCIGVLPRYIYWYLKFIEDELREKGKGSTFVQITSTDIRSIPILLPPLNEQKRIVDKLDQLMTFCDRLKETIIQRQMQSNHLKESAFTHLQQAQTGEELQTNLNFILNHFNTLCTRKEDVQLLRQTILSLAVQGKLVPQDPNDEPASVLLEKIKEEKERLVKEKKIRKQKALPPIEEEEVPCKVPKGWIYSRLGTVGIINPRNIADDDIEASFVPMNLIPTEFKAQHESEIKQWGKIKSGYTHFAESDVVVAKITPCFENGKSAVMRNLKNGIGAGTTELHVFRPLEFTIIPEYVLIFFKSPFFLNTCEEKMTGTAGQKRVPKSLIENFPFPLPPLNEQKRIVAKLDKLMSLCDQLEEQLERSDQAVDRLLQASLRQAFSKEPKAVSV